MTTGAEHASGVDDPELEALADVAIEPLLEELVVVPMEDVELVVATLLAEVLRVLTPKGEPLEASPPPQATMVAARAKNTRALRAG